MVRGGTAELNKVSAQVSENSIPMTECGDVFSTGCTKRGGGEELVPLALVWVLQPSPSPGYYNGRKGRCPRGNWMQQRWVAPNILQLS